MVRKGVCHDQSRSLISGSAPVESTYFSKLVSINGNGEASKLESVLEIYIFFF